MARNDLKTIQYSGSGFAYAFGQSYLPGGPYPKFYAKYSRAIDFDKRLSREETMRTQFENPPRGGGGQPLYRAVARRGRERREFRLGRRRGGTHAARLGESGDGLRARP